MSEPSLADLEARLAATDAATATPKERIDALNELAWTLRFSESARANDLAREARQLAMQQQYPLGQARAARTLAMTVRTVEDLPDVFRMAKEAKRLFDDAGDALGRAASRDFLASVHEHIGDLAGGLELALDALAIAREIGDPIRQGYALSSVGGILAASGETDTAVERLKMALELFEGVGDSEGVGTICSRLSKVLIRAGQNEDASVYAKKLLEVAGDKQDTFLRADALTVMARVSEAQGQSDEAERLYREALSSMPNRLSRSVMGAEASLALGRLLLRKGALQDAKREFQDTLKQIEGDSVSFVNEATAHEALADLHEQLGELPTALQHLRRAKALREEISARDARNKRAQIEVRAAMENAEKNAELQKSRFVELHGMQSKLVVGGKMALLGKLAAGTAHELNTPLGVLRSNAALTKTATDRLLALMGVDDPARSAQAEKLSAVLRSCRETSDQAMNRIASIAQSFRRFTQLDQAELCSFDVREGLDSALSLLAPTLPASITVERDFGEVPNIVGWPRELNQAFMTVLQNAVQAIEGTGVIAVETSARDEVRVQIRDTGRGMSEQEAAHLFDVAWSDAGNRTKMRLGLSAAYTTLQQHGGTIEAQSAPGEGTTITFRFPIPAN